MDNASKAVLMAGSVLIAIAVISVSLYMYSIAKGYAETSENTLSVTQIQSFNRFYTAYTDDTIKCIDAINILNRALEDNVKVETPVSEDIIKLSGDTYVATDSKHYLQKKFKYSLERDAAGMVNLVKIDNIAPAPAPAGG